ncbi:hypothetical protein, partial [uncultured Jannaschia sp.]|uniref:hypothetical protein n=1 Tax=uncultured Jannaschia sp. TaxID=293347 RepID=UPI002601DBED
AISARFNTRTTTPPAGQNSGLILSSYEGALQLLGQKLTPLGNFPRILATSLNPVVCPLKSGPS